MLYYSSVTTHPEVRPDSNGKLVTRHVKDETVRPAKIGRVAAISVAPDTGHVSCHFCYTSYIRGDGHICEVRGLVKLSLSATKVFDACSKIGSPLLVGGSVRDAVIGKIDGKPAASPKDVDIEVYGITDAAELTRELGKIGKVFEAGVAFGVIKVVVDGEDFDVSLPRRDSKRGSGHRGFDVEIDPDISTVEAFGRRDFTINAMGYDPRTHELHDPYGGSYDAENKTIRHTTDAFAEDPLRVLRAMQFASRLDYDLAPETAAECRRIKGSFAELAAERVWGEFGKVFTKGQSVSTAIDVLKATEWIEHFPTLARLEDVEQDARWHPEGNVLNHLGLSGDQAIARSEGLNEEDRLLLVLATTVHDFGKHGSGTQYRTDENGEVRITSHGHESSGDDAILDFMKRIGAPQHLQKPVLTLVRTHMRHLAAQDGAPSATAARKLLRTLSDGDERATFDLWCRLVDADTNGRLNETPVDKTTVWREVVSRLGQSTSAKPLVRGDMLMEMGLKPSPLFRDIIAASVIAQDEGVFADSEGAREWVARYIETLPVTAD